jgi:hypothetical protein
VVDVLDYSATGGTLKFNLVFQDSVRQITNDNGYWRYQRPTNDGKKINPYFTMNYDLTKTSWAYSNFKSFYVKMKYNVGPVKLGADAAWIALYSANTTGTADAVNKASWYRSRANYLAFVDPAPSTNQPVYLYVGEKPDTACSSLYFPSDAVFVKTGFGATPDFVSGTGYTVKNFANDEIMSRLSFHTNSNAAAASVDVTIFEAGYCFAAESKQIITRFPAVV